MLEEVAHDLLDLYITIVSTPANDPSLQLFSPSPVSPREPGSRAGASSSRSARPSPGPVSAATTAFRLHPGWNAQSLTELKIHLRDRRPGAAVGWDEGEDGDEMDPVDGMGRNDGTMRFVWDDEA